MLRWALAFWDPWILILIQIKPALTILIAECNSFIAECNLREAPYWQFQSGINLRDGRVILSEITTSFIIAKFEESPSLIVFSLVFSFREKITEKSLNDFQYNNVWNPRNVKSREFTFYSLISIYLLVKQIREKTKHISPAPLIMHRLIHIVNFSLSNKSRKLNNDDTPPLTIQTDTLDCTISSKSLIDRIIYR